MSKEIDEIFKYFKDGKIVVPCSEISNWIVSEMLEMQCFGSVHQSVRGAGQNIPGQNIPCHFLTAQTKHPTKICLPGQNIPSCFCHP